MAINERIISIDHDDNDDVDIKSFSNFMDDVTKRKKNSMADDFIITGEELIEEVREKNQKKEFQKLKLIIFILKNDKKKIYSEKALKSYSLEDVQIIYNDIKNNKNLFKKLFRFIFNL